MFTPGLEIRRSSIHDQYGGNRQRGISNCARFPYIFIFSGDSGHQHGYVDEWLNRDVYSYTGEGQSGDMSFTGGNKALLNHKENNKKVFLFKALGNGNVVFIEELELLDFDYFTSPDTNGASRTAIKFFFSRANAHLTYKDTIPHVAPETELDLPEYFAPNSTERTGLVTSRVGQGAYRKSIIHRWENRCAVTDYNENKILIASHIVPWRIAEEIERLDVNNGILLSPVYDALFDKHLISFGDEGKILLTKELKHTNYEKLGVTGQERIQNFREGNIEYLQRHRREAGI